MYVVYCHTNRINGKRYVGWATITRRKAPHHAMMRRWGEHATQRGSECMFHDAICKYGIDVWDHELLEVMSTLKGAKHAEKLWIAQRKTYAFDPDGWGYNMTRGGDGISGYKFSKEECRRRAERKQGRRLSLEERRKISERS